MVSEQEASWTWEYDWAITRLILAMIFMWTLSSWLSYIFRTYTWKYRLSRIQEPWVSDWVVAVGHVPENTDWVVSRLILIIVFVLTLSSWLSCTWIDTDLKTVLGIGHSIQLEKDWSIWLQLEKDCCIWIQLEKDCVYLTVTREGLCHVCIRLQLKDGVYPTTAGEGYPINPELSVQLRNYQGRT